MALISLILKAADEYSATLMGLNQGLELVGRTISGIGSVTSALTGGLGLVFDGLSAVASVALSPITMAFDSLKASISYVYESIKGLLGYLYDGISYAAGIAWDSIKSVADFMWTSFKDVLSYIWTSVKDISSMAYESIKQWTMEAIKSTIEVGNQFEQIRVKMTTIWGSSGVAKQALEWAAQFGRETPLTLDQVASAMIKLKTYGFDPMDGTLRKVGDAAYALGTDFDGIVTALGQMRLKGKVTAEELMQLAERNVPAYRYLQEAFGLSAEQMANIGKAGLDVDKAIKAIVDGMGNQFAGAMEKASKTAAGMWSNIEDTIMVFQKRLLDSGVWELYTKQLEKVKATVESLLTDSFATSLSSSVKSAMSEVFGLFDKLFNSIVSNSKNIIDIIIVSIKTTANIYTELYDAIAKSINLWGGAGNIFSSTKTILEESAKFMISLVKQIPEFVPAIKAVFTQLKSGAESVITYLTPALGKLPGQVESLAKDAYATFSKYMPDIKNTIGLVVNGVTNGIKGVSAALAAVFVDGRTGFDTINRAIVAIANLLANVFKLAEGFLGGSGSTLINLAIDGVNQVSKGLASIGDWLPEIIAGVNLWYSGLLKVFTGFINVVNLISENKTSISAFFVSAFNAGIEGVVNFGKFAVSAFETFISYGPAIYDVLRQIVAGLATMVKNTSLLILSVASDLANAFSKTFDIGAILIDGVKAFVYYFLRATSLLVTELEDLLGVKIMPEVDLALKANDIVDKLASYVGLAGEVEINFVDKYKDSIDSLKVPEIEFKAPDTSKIKSSLDQLSESASAFVAKTTSGLQNAFNSLSANFKGTLDTTAIESAAGSITGIFDGVMKQFKDGKWIEIGADLDTSKLDKIDKDIKLTVDPKEIEKIKGEVTVRLEGAQASGLSETAIMMALTKFIKGQLLADAASEGLPLAVTN